MKVDLTAMNAYLARKNEEEKDFPYTMFHIVVAALEKTITLRPKLNRFIVNSNFYQRNEVSAAFVVKKQFSDKGAEALAFLHGKETDTVAEVHDYIRRQVTECRSEKVDASTAGMDMFNKMPRWMGKAIVRFLMFLDRHGWVPSDLIATDPYYSSVVISNLGSIKLKCGYHHLTNWGTCSVFCIIGEKKMSPFYDADGNVTRTWYDLSVMPVFQEDTTDVDHWESKPEWLRGCVTQDDNAKPYYQVSVVAELEVVENDNGEPAYRVLLPDMANVLTSGDALQKFTTSIQVETMAHSKADGKTVGTPDAEAVKIGD